MSKTLFIDVARCSGCNNCFLACRDEFVDNAFPPYSVSQPRHGQKWINVLCRERGSFPRVSVSYLPKPCMHCEKPACGGKPRADGIVLLPPEPKEDRSGDCPYGTLYYDGERGVLQKCTMCAHLLDEGWAEPRCVTACPDGALRFLDPDKEDMSQWESYLPETGTGPRVYYRNLGLYTKHSVAGCAVRGGECLAGVEVALADKFCLTNAFGEFRIDGLPDGDYGLRASWNGQTRTVLVSIAGCSVDVGDITFDGK